MPWQSQQHNRHPPVASKAPLSIHIWAVCVVPIPENTEMFLLFTQQPAPCPARLWDSKPRTQGRRGRGRRTRNEASTIPTSLRKDLSLLPALPRELTGGGDGLTHHQHRIKAPLLRAAWLCWKCSLRELQERFRR